MIEPVICKKKRGKKQPFDLMAICQPGYYHIPDLVALLNKGGCSVAYAVAELAAQLKANRNFVSTYRTSEIFITGQQTRGGRVEKRRLSFYPQIDGYWISHFSIRKPDA